MILDKVVVQRVEQHLLLWIRKCRYVFTVSAQIFNLTYLSVCPIDISLEGVFIVIFVSGK